jgi:hypothetical protein
MINKRLLVNYNTEIKDIHYSKIEHINFFTKKIKFYNPDIEDEVLQKFWYSIDNVKIIENNDNNIVIVFPHKKTDLIKSINNLDTITENVINELKPDIKNKIGSSIILTKNFPPQMTLNIDKKIKEKLNDFSEDTKFSIYIEFDNIIISNSCSRKWKVLEIDKMVENIMVENIMVENNMNLLKIPLAPPAPPAPPPKITLPLPQPLNLPFLRKVSEHNLSPIKKKEVDLEQGFRPPSVNDLLGSITKLKKTFKTEVLKTEVLKTEVLKEEVLKETPKKYIPPSKNVNSIIDMIEWLDMSFDDIQNLKKNVKTNVLNGDKEEIRKFILSCSTNDMNKIVDKLICKDMKQFMVEYKKTNNDIHKIKKEINLLFNNICQ